MLSPSRYTGTGAAAAAPLDRSTSALMISHSSSKVERSAGGIAMMLEPSRPGSTIRTGRGMPGALLRSSSSP
eukprot:scaffold106854_cov72-Phaeocystis_antarctica.AAC.7